MEAPSGGPEGQVEGRAERPIVEGSGSRAAPGAGVQAGASRRIVTIPNALSLARLSSVPVFLYLFLTRREEAAVIVYGLFAWTDFFDGYLARRWGQVSELGKLLDPLSDRVFILALAIALVARGTLPAWLAAAVIGRDLIVISLFPLLERRKVPRLAVNFTGKTATACLLLGLTLLALSETTFGVADLGGDLGLPICIAGAVLYWVAGAMYGREVVRRLREMAA